MATKAIIFNICFPWQLRQSYLIFACTSAGQRISRSSLIVEDLRIFKFYVVARAPVLLVLPRLLLLQLLPLLLLTYLLIVLLLITAILVILTFEVLLDCGQRAIHGLLCTCQIRALIKTLAMLQFSMFKSIINDIVIAQCHIHALVKTLAMLQIIINVQKQYQWYHHLLNARSVLWLKWLAMLHAENYQDSKVFSVLSWLLNARSYSSVDKIVISVLFQCEKYFNQFWSVTIQKSYFVLLSRNCKSFICFMLSVVQFVLACPYFQVKLLIDCNHVAWSNRTSVINKSIRVINLLPRS